MNKVLFIGLGHMGSSLVKGILHSPTQQFEVYGFDAFLQTSLKVKQQLPNLKLLNDLSELETIEIDLIIIGVRPIDIKELIDQLDQFDLTNKTIVSMVNAVGIKELASYFTNNEVEIVRMMPNMNAAIQQSVTGLAYHKSKPKALDVIVNLFEKCGIVEIVKETDFATLTAISGCSPAYIFTFYKAIIDFAITNGFTETQAMRIIHQAIIGSINYAATSDLTLNEMINNICVPNGSTIQGQNVLVEKKFAAIMQKCLQAAKQASE